jgi:hypothetical protein
VFWRLSLASKGKICNDGLNWNMRLVANNVLNYEVNVQLV